MRITCTAFGVGLIGFGLIMRLNVGQSLDYVESQTEWPKVTATVTALDVWISKDHRGGGVYFYPAFKFDYLANGELFKGRTKFGEAYEDRDEAVLIAGKSEFQPGTSADIHYNPASPEITAYEPGKEVLFLKKLMHLGACLLVAGFVLTLFGVVLLLTSKVRGMPDTESSTLRANE